MKANVHSILVFDKKAVGVRFGVTLDEADKGSSSNILHTLTSDSGMLKPADRYDVEIEALKSVDKELLRQYKAEKLIEHGALLVTQEELEKNILVQDVSNNKLMVDFLIKSITKKEEPKKEEPKQAVKPKEVPKKAEKKKGLKEFKAVVEYEVYNPKLKKFEKVTVEATTQSKSALLARKELKNWYAQEQGTDPNEITIVSLEMVE